MTSHDSNAQLRRKYLSSHVLTLNGDSPISSSFCPDKISHGLDIIDIPGVPKKTLHVFESLFFDVM